MLVSTVFTLFCRIMFFNSFLVIMADVELPFGYTAINHHHHHHHHYRHRHRHLRSIEG